MRLTMTLISLSTGRAHVIGISHFIVNQETIRMMDSHLYLMWQTSRSVILFCIVALLLFTFLSQYVILRSLCEFQ